MADRNLVVKHRGGIYSTGEGMEVHIPPSGFNWRSTTGNFSIIDPYGEDTIQRFPLGTKLVYGDKFFRYALNGAGALTAGKVNQGAALVSGHHQDMVTAAAAVGAVGITVTPITGNITLNQYLDGTLYVNDLVGEGNTYRVLSTPAITAAATGVIALMDPVHTVLDATSLTGLRKNLFEDVIEVPITTMTGAVSGVNTKAVTAAVYFWTQTRGDAAIQTVGTSVVGQNAEMNLTTTAGTVGPAAGNVLPMIGVFRQAGVTTDKSLVFVTLE